MKKTTLYAFATLSLIITLSVGLHLGGLDVLTGGTPASAQSIPDRKVQALSKFTDLFANLPSSSTLKNDVPYALPDYDIYTELGGGYYGPMTMDINGDGLNDLILSHVTQYGSSQTVMLNTGDGYNYAYICEKRIDRNTFQASYKGDCAA